MIDAHQHFWQIGRHDCRWPTPDLAAIHRDFGPADYAAATDGLGISGSVLVQSQESDRDTDYLLALAEETPQIYGVVGWTDLGAPSAPARIEALAARPKLKGLRPMLQGLAVDEWILSPGLTPAIDAMTRHGLTFDALVFTRHLPFLRRFAQAHPDLPIMIDHGAKPPLDNGNLEDWAKEMAAISVFGNVWCKLSGLPTEAGDDTPPAVIAGCIETLLTLFGEDRLVWGSDWPVVTLASSLPDWLALAQSVTGPSDAIYRDNAVRFYGLTA